MQAKKLFIQAIFGRYVWCTENDFSLTKHEYWAGWVLHRWTRWQLWTERSTLVDNEIDVPIYFGWQWQWQWHRWPVYFGWQWQGDAGSNGGIVELSASSALVRKLRGGWMTRDGRGELIIIIVIILIIIIDIVEDRMTFRRRGCQLC